MAGLSARIGVTAVAVTATIGLAACGTSPKDASGGTIEVAASINAWGSVLSQLGGTHVHVSSIISNPDTDPHDYEPTPADARIVSMARLFVTNGIGYDPWAKKALAANPDSSRIALDVGQVTGVAEGGNPHRWYSPADVEKVADAITADLKKLEPPAAAYFDRQRQVFEDVGLSAYHQTIKDIKAKYAGTAVGASESIFAPLAEALGLNLVTPPGFLQAISQGTDPSIADKQTIDDQIATKKIKVYVFNSQNSTPDVTAQVDAATRTGIVVTSVTETLSPAGVTFQDWQTTQLKALEQALAKATGL